MRSIGERIWKHIKKIFLRDLVKKEEAAQMREEQAASEYIIAPRKQRRSMLSFFPRRHQKIPRRHHRQVEGTAPAPEYSYIFHVKFYLVSRSMVSL